MPKTKISEWSSTPANNTDIDSINIAEGCAPSGINDAIRELMSQVKDLYAGTSGDLIGVAGGGTGAGTLTGIVKGNGTSAFSAATAGTDYVSPTGTETLTNKTLTAPIIDNPKLGYTTTATAAGTTTLTVTSNHQQFFTGTTTQTIVLPVTSTLVLGMSYLIENNSTGVLTVQSSGLNAITTIPAGVTTLFTCILTSGTTAASWDYDQVGFATITGTGSAVLATSPTLVTPALGTPSSATLTNATGLPLSTGVTGTLPVANGGTGLTTTPANGALDIGNGTGFTRGTLTAGTNITITNSAGGISIAASGGSTSPGGSTTQVQYNNAGAFAGSSNFIFDGNNVGVGVTPNTSWGSSFKAIQVGSTAALQGPTSGNGTSTLMNNAYINSSGDYVYLTTGVAHLLTQSSTGRQQFWSADSGTAATTASMTSIFSMRKGYTVALEGASQTTGTGIAFPATQSASSDANTLDDYEEGTFDVTVTMGTSGTCTMDSTLNKMKYTKIGRVVTIQGQIQVSSVSSPVGDMRMSLPFTNATTDEGASLSGCVPRFYNVLKPATGLYPYVFVNNSNAYMEMQWVVDNGATISHIPAAGNFFIINFSYCV